MSLPVPRKGMPKHQRMQGHKVTAVAATATLTGMLTSTVLLSQMWENSTGSVATRNTQASAPTAVAVGEAGVMWPVAAARPAATAEQDAAARAARFATERAKKDQAERDRARAQRIRQDRAQQDRAQQERARQARAKEDRAEDRASRSRRQDSAQTADARKPRSAQRTVKAHSAGRPTEHRSRQQKRKHTTRTVVRTASRSSRGVPARVAALNWKALARCEATGNPKAVNPSGKYFGLYQFDRRTWRSVGGSGLPTSASASEQTYRAQLLYLQRGGASAWPSCGRLLFR